MKNRVISIQSLFLTAFTGSLFFIGTTRSFGIASVSVESTRSFQKTKKQQTRARQFFSSNSNDNNESSSDSSSSLGTYNPFRLAVLKLGLTEPRFVSTLNYETRQGVYKCADCKTPLFKSEGKYDSKPKSGWPSFFKSYDEESLNLYREWDGRMEITCKNCKGE